MELESETLDDTGCVHSLEMHTLNISFTETSTKSDDLDNVEEGISQKCKWDLCRCLCRCFDSTGQAHSCTEPQATDTKLQSKSWKSWKQPNINIADLLFMSL